jgi:CheY-like chemotaxis protein
MDTDQVQRLAVVEDEIGTLRTQIASLNDLREQLSQILAALRRGPMQRLVEDPPARNGSRTASNPSGCAKVDPHSMPASSTLPAPAQEGDEGLNGSAVRVVHLEDQGELRESIKTTVAKFGYARYDPEQALSLNGNRLLVLNLLLQSQDPLALVIGRESGVERNTAFAYFAEGNRGLVLGMVDFFPPPLDPHTCVTRLLERRGPTQRVLVVSDAVDVATELRGILSRLGSATSVAFDAKQALSLVPMVRPDIILVDLNLPRADSVRVAGRVRADPTNAEVGFALMWHSTIDTSQFQREAARVLRDFSFSDSELRRTFGRELTPGGAGFAARTAAKRR